MKYRQIRSQVTATIAIRILVVLVLADLGNAAKVTEFINLKGVRFVVIFDCIRKAELIVFGKFIIRGVELKTNYGRQHLNINRTFNIDNFSVATDIGKTIDDDSIKRLMDKVKKKNPKGIARK
ncbi:MAG: hypothetical protein LBC74_13140 [Planctomycetaceae bacterium]|nr:hypothetical protein [Planctomycetaceae bacterium]